MSACNRAAVNAKPSGPKTAMTPSARELCDRFAAAFDATSDEDINLRIARWLVAEEPKGDIGAHATRR
jgi:hypothetical protein